MVKNETCQRRGKLTPTATPAAAVATATATIVATTIAATAATAFVATAAATTISAATAFVATAAATFVAATAATFVATTTTATSAWFTCLSRVDSQRTALVVLVIQCGNSCISTRYFAHRNKCKPTWAACFTVGYDFDSFNGAVGAEEVGNLIFSSGEGQIAHIDIHNSNCNKKRCYVNTPKANSE